jgi:hypothetical protein
MILLRPDEAFDEVQTAAAASKFGNHTTLREADLTPALTALHRRPALTKIHLSAEYVLRIDFRG